MDLLLMKLLKKRKTRNAPTIYHAQQLFMHGKYKEAASEFGRLLHKNLENTDLLFSYALSTFNMRQWSKAIKLWKMLLKLSPNEPNAHLNLGCAYHNIKNYKLAIRHYKLELKHNPTSPETLFSLGNLYYKLKKYDLTIRYLQACFALKHSLDQISSKLADAYFRTGRIDKEMDVYCNWLERHPNDGWALNNIAAVLMQKGEYNRALLFLRRAKQADPKDRITARNIRKAEHLRKALVN